MSSWASRFAIRGLVGVVAVGVVVVAALVALPRALETERGRDLASGLIRRFTGYELRSAAVDIVGGTTVAMRGLVVAVPAGGTLLAARRARVEIQPAGVLDGRLFDIELEEFVLDLSVLDGDDDSQVGARKRERDEDGPAMPPLRQFRAVDGTLRWQGRDGRASLLIDNVTLHGERDSGFLTTQGHLRLPEGAGRLVWSGRYDAATGTVELDLDGDWPDLPSAAAMLGFDLPDLGGVLGMSVRGQMRGNLRGETRADLDAALGGDAPLAGANATLRITHWNDTGSAQAKAEVHVGHGIPPMAVTAVVPSDRASPIETSLSWQQVPLNELAARAVPWLDVERVEGRAALSISTASGRDGLDVDAHVSVDDLALEDSGLRVQASGEASLAYDGATLRFGERGLRLSDIQVRSSAGSVSAGEIAILGDVRPAAPNLLVRVRSLLVGELAASNPTWTRAIEGAEIAGEGSLAFAVGGEPRLRARLEIKAGEALWDRVYANVESLEPVLELDVRRTDAGFAIDRFDGVLEGIGTFDSHFVYRQEAGLESGALAFEVPGLGHAFDMLVREPLAESWPSMGGSSVTGRLSGGLNYTAEPEGARLDGRIDLVEAGLDIDNGRSIVSGVELSLPLNLSTDGRSYGGSQTGRLAIESMRLRGATVPSVVLPLRTRTNEIAATATVDVDLLGGRVSFGDLRARTLTTAERSVSMWLTARDVDLASLTEAAALPAATGVLDATFSSVRAGAGEIVADGRIHLELLGGQVALTGLKLSDIGTRIPRVHADIEARGIDLGEASGALGVGRIEGVVDGRVTGLQIVDGQPVSFDAELASVPTRGVKQRISVTAIEQLSILGGAAASPMTRAVLGFFDEYRYAKMGARCSLRNDRFLLRGVESYEEKDFLVVGTFMPPTVNVVSHNQVIAFNEMVRRLGRIADVAGGSGAAQSPAQGD